MHGGGGLTRSPPLQLLGLPYEWLERDEGVSSANVAVGWLIRF
jgi:hypothetical protein